MLHQIFKTLSNVICQNAVVAPVVYGCISTTPKIKRAHKNIVPNLISNHAD